MTEVVARPIFLDSNILLYLLSADPSKADTAERLLRAEPTISVQVLNEITHVCRRKHLMSWPEISRFLGLLQGFCKVLPLTTEVHERARRIAERHQLAFYDACIAAAAIQGDCRILYSEDLNHGQMLDESLRIQNPFRAG